MKISRIAVLTSGGDAPGMNAAIRAVVRAAVYYEVEVYGVYGGYNGLIEGHIEPFNVRSVANILGSGGTLLKCSRSEAFKTKEGRALAVEQLKSRGIDALIVIGGDGTLKGAHALSEESDIKVVGIPGTIDNDLAHTDSTIGFDTATNVAMHCIDNIRDTASSHDRLFFVEVMGRHTGFIALRSAIATGAICVMVPEHQITLESLVATLRKGHRNRKTSSIVIVAEGNKLGGAVQIAAQVSALHKDYETKVTILGHLQRGGVPTCADRLLAGELGVGAVEALIDGENDVMIGQVDNRIKRTAIMECVNHTPELNPNHLKIAHILSI